MIGPLEAVRLKTALQRRAAALQPPLYPPRGFSRLTPRIGRAAHVFLHAYLTRLHLNPWLTFATPQVHRLLLPAFGPGALGIDVSNNNGSVGWAHVPKNVRFAFCKVSEGTTFADAYWRANREVASQHGILVGGYHFAHIGRGVANAVQQADFFCQHLGQQRGMLRPAIDWEADGCANPDHLPELVAMADRVRAHTGLSPILYGSSFTFRDLHVQAGSRLASSPLWIGAYPRIPFTPPPWRAVAVDQYTDVAWIPGVGKCDANRLLRPLSEIQ